MGSLQFLVGEEEQVLLSLDANKRPGNSWKLFFVAPIIAALQFFSCREDLRGLMSVSQHSFIKGCSTGSNLIEFTSFVLEITEEGLQVDSMCINFSKALSVEPAFCD
jgi:hypothetical protein